MRRELYVFKEDDAIEFARKIGAYVTRKGEELSFKYCPYCKGGKGKRDRETFAINLKTGAFNCKRAGCGVTGNMLTIAKDFDFSLGKEIDEYYSPRKKYREFKSRDKPIQPKDAAIEYMKSRGISEEITRKYEITVTNSDENVLVFPFYDETNHMRFVKYRRIDHEKGKGSKEWCERDCKPILFGMKQCDTESKTLICCEGQIDQLSVAECGYLNSVSVPLGKHGFTWVSYCWDWIQQFDEIIVFGDYENGEITLLDEIYKRFGQKVKHVREEDYQDCKDANEILLKYGKDQIVKCIENAVSVPINRIIELADVEDVNIYEIEKFPTGIRELDKLLCGGLPFGGLHILTAKAGSGKSTFANQILARARFSGYKCMVYSGELPKTIFKDWFSYQIAGRSHVIEYQNPDYGFQGYTVSKANKKLISDWYRGYIYFYDSETVDDEGDEPQGLVKLVEDVIRQYGVRVILLDNLMTAMFMDEYAGENENVRQTKFINKLRIMAIKYNVVILLIAHMRKNNFSQGGNDEVAGSSNITNLATITFSYERDADLPDDKRKIRLMKNRLFGKINMEGIPVSYDEKSRRIFGAGDNVDFNYGFDVDNSNNDGFIDALPDDIPFDFED